MSYFQPLITDDLPFESSLIYNVSEVHRFTMNTWNFGTLELWNPKDLFIRKVN